MPATAARPRIGIDLGGTKIECLLLGGDGTPLARQRIATPRGDYEATLDAVAALARACDARAGQDTSVGVGMPGALSPATGLVKNANSTWLNGRPLLQDLMTRLGPRVRVANDANCFALSEAVDGAAAGAGVVFGVILGTGTGGGIVVDRRLLVGAHAIGGEWGHNPVPWPEPDEWPGPPCYCGRTGCIETVLSGPGLAREHAEQTGDLRTAEAIMAAAAAGNMAAMATRNRYAGRLARALASVINLLDPDVIVLGGGLSKVDWLYKAVPAMWGRWVFSDVVTTPLVQARHGDASGVRGAAWLWPAESRT